MKKILIDSYYKTIHGSVRSEYSSSMVKIALADPKGAVEMHAVCQIIVWHSNTWHVLQNKRVSTLSIKSWIRHWSQPLNNACYITIHCEQFVTKYFEKFKNLWNHHLYHEYRSEEIVRKHVKRYTCWFGVYVWTTVTNEEGITHLQSPLINNLLFVCWYFTEKTSMM